MARPRAASSARVQPGPVHGNQGDARRAGLAAHADRRSAEPGGRLRHGPLSEAERRELLSRITYRQWLTDYLGAPDEAVVQYQRLSHGLLGTGVQAVSALDMWLLGNPGFGAGNQLGHPTDAAIPGMGRTPQMVIKSVQDPTLYGPNADQPHVRGRAAISEAYRAVNDLPDGR